MRTDWDLDVNVVNFVLTDATIVRQLDKYPVIVDLDAYDGLVEIEITLPVLVDELQKALDGLRIDPVLCNLILATVDYGNARALMYGTPTAPKTPSSADPREMTFKEFQPA